MDLGLLAPDIAIEIFLYFDIFVIVKFRRISKKINRIIDNHLLNHSRFYQAFKYTGWSTLEQAKTETILTLQRPCYGHQLSTVGKELFVAPSAILQYFSETKQYMYIPNINHDVFIYDNVKNLLLGIKSLENPGLFASKNLGRARKHYPIGNGLSPAYSDVNTIFTHFDSRNGNIIGGKMIEGSDFVQGSKWSPWSCQQFGDVVVYVHNLAFLNGIGNCNILIQIFQNEKMIYEQTDNAFGSPIYFGNYGFFHHQSDWSWIWVDSTGKIVSNKTTKLVFPVQPQNIICKRNGVYIIDTLKSQIYQILPIQRKIDKMTNLDLIIKEFESIETRALSMMINRVYSSRIDINRTTQKVFNAVSDSLTDHYLNGFYSKSFCSRSSKMITPDGLFQINADYALTLTVVKPKEEPPIPKPTIWSKIKSMFLLK